MLGGRAEECCSTQHTPCCEPNIRARAFHVTESTFTTGSCLQNSCEEIDERMILIASLGQPQQVAEPTLSAAGLSQGGAPSKVAGGPLAHSILPSWLHLGVHLCRDTP